MSADGNDVTEARLLTKNDDGTFFDAVAQGTPPTYDHVPPGARPGYAETTHALIGYGTADGKTVWLIEAAAAR